MPFMRLAETWREGTSRSLGEVGGLEVGFRDRLAFLASLKK